MELGNEYSLFQAASLIQLSAIQQSESFYPPNMVADLQQPIKPESILLSCWFWRALYTSLITRLIQMQPYFKPHRQ